MKIQSNNLSFGIYKQTIATSYGQKVIGAYKNKNITIHYDYKDGTKMFYVADSFNKWVKSKLEYFRNGIKKVIWSYAK